MNASPAHSVAGASPGSAPVNVVGCAATEFLVEHNAMLDELVFDVVERALREAGLRKQDLGIAVLASLDVLDGRSISSGLTNAAAGGYLSDSFRVQGDAGVAILSAAEAIASGDFEVAVAVGVHNPETTGSPSERASFLEQVSNLAFEPLFDRPVGLTSQVAWAVHAAHAMEAQGFTCDQYAEIAASQVARGRDSARAVRTEGTTPAEVLASAPVAWPLRELMLPAPSTGAVAVVLASPARAGRCVGRDAQITGMGHATGGPTWDGAWLSDPCAASRRAAEMAYRSSTRSGSEVVVAEVTAATPALHSLTVDALQLTQTTNINPSGGAMSNFPGLANGGLRLLEVLEHLTEHGPGALGLSHSVDTISGTIAQDVSVLVVEGL